jgi:hypothetical protein
MEEEIARLSQHIARLEHGREYKNTLIHALEKKCSTLEKGCCALQRRVVALEYEKNEKDTTITTLTLHLRLKIKEQDTALNMIRTLAAHQEILELKLMNTYGRLSSDVEQYRYCGWGCEKCDEQTLTDLKNLFACRK